MTEKDINMESNTGREATKEEIDGRKKYQAELTLKAGQVFNAGTIRKCRKIFTSVTSGTIQFEIRGRYASDLVCNAGFQGGPLSGGGGDFPPGTIDFKVIAKEDATFYIHLEWIEGSIITFGG